MERGSGGRSSAVGCARNAGRGRGGAGEGWRGSRILGVAFIMSREGTGGAAGERMGCHQWRLVQELMGHRGGEVTLVLDGRGAGVVAHLPAVKVAGGLHDVDGARMRGDGGCVAIRPEEEEGGTGWLGQKGEAAQDRRGRRAGLEGKEAMAPAGLGQGGLGRLGRLASAGPAKRGRGGGLRSQIVLKS
jgi:hypothetical protein